MVPNQSVNPCCLPAVQPPFDTLMPAESISETEACDVEFAVGEEGQRTIEEVERLQAYVLDELDSLQQRISRTFRAFGYKDEPPAADGSFSTAE